MTPPIAIQDKYEVVSVVCDEIGGERVDGDGKG